MKARAFGFRGEAGGFGARYEGIVITAAQRTPFGKFMGALARVSPTDLGIIAARAALAQSGCLAKDIDQVIFAAVGQSGPDAFYLPRHIGLYAGIPQHVPAALVGRICGSGFEVLIAGAEQIALGKAFTVLCGGTESMTRNPLASYGARLGMDMGKPDFVDTLIAELFDPACGNSMGQTAENLAKRYAIARQEVDALAIRSQDRAAAAWAAGRFTSEVTTVAAGKLEAAGLQARKVVLPKKMVGLERDEHPRTTTIEQLAALDPVFATDGVQTAGNSSGIVDGAAVAVLCAEEMAAELGMKPLGRISAAATVGVEPSLMGSGPVPATRLLLEQVGLTLADIDLIEVNEAFGAQYLAVEKALGLDPAKTNVNGGAIALGHPLAATGTRLVATLLYELERRQLRRGLATACIGGGQGTAILVERA
ncbi:MAG: thiolase family protein [Cyanobacteria bacterium NC_groundwater_1444_Ag_S-0.65um_54_12]|nr:thiolase family protein [Cyanobacteria bacterium NC_groundwater_1444_Ag_S-0.65um_54_12]